MREKAKGYFTSGEFAKLCGTTKETLRHYDAIELLQPEKRGENGYNYYGAWQFFDYDLIDTLKEANCSLKEIKEYLDHHHNTENFLKFLREKEKQLIVEKEKLQRMQGFLSRTIEMTEYASQTPYGVPQLQHCQEEYLVALPVPEGDEITLVEMIDRMRQHYEYVEERKLGEDYIMGTIVLQETLLTGQYYDSYYYTKIPTPTDSERLVIKPEGDYVTMLHKGSYRGMPESYEKIMRYMKEKGLEICGNSYEYDMITHLATEDVKDFITQIAVQVRKKA